MPTDDEHVAEFAAPANVDYRFRGKPMRDLLLSGEIDAAIGEIGVEAPEIKPLIPDARNAALRLFPQDRHLSDQPRRGHQELACSRTTPWIADELDRAFETAKAEYLKNLQGSASMSSWDQAAADNAAVVGDPFPFGIEPNRKALEAITQFAVDQKMVPRKFSVEELFAPVNYEAAASQIDRWVRQDPASEFATQQNIKLSLQGWRTPWPN